MDMVAIQLDALELALLTSPEVVKGPKKLPALVMAEAARRSGRKDLVERAEKIIIALEGPDGLARLKGGNSPTRDGTVKRRRRWWQFWK